MEIVLLCAYAGLLMHLSRRGGRPAAASFFVAGRSGGAVGVAFSLIVSCVGASATMGMAGMAWSIGTPAFWWLGSGAAGLACLALLLAGKVRESGSLTMPELVERLLGPGARVLVSVIVVAAWTAILAAQFAALGKLVASLLTGVPALPCLAVAFVLTVVHTLGGQAAVMRTDRVQFYILAAGLGALLWWLSAENPGWTAGVRVEAMNERFGGADLAHYIFAAGGNYLVCPMLFGRLLSARDPAAARHGGLLAALGLLACGALIVAVGLACRGVVPPGTPPDAALTTALDTAFPRWLAVPALLALMSAVVSSADSCLVTAATVLSYDLLRSGDAARGRLCVLGLGCAGMALTFMEKDILGFLFMAYDVYVAGVVMPVFIALLFSRRRAARRDLALAAIAVGGVLGGLAALTGRPGFSLAGMLVSAMLATAGVIAGKRAGNFAAPPA